MVEVLTWFNVPPQLTLNQKLQGISLQTAVFRTMIPKLCSRIRGKNRNHSCVTFFCASFRAVNVETDVKVIADLEERVVTAFM